MGVGMSRCKLGLAGVNVPKVEFEDITARHPTFATL